MPLATLTPAAATMLAAGVTTAGSLVSGKLGSNATTDAAKIQADSAQKALDEKKRLFDIETAQRKPYLDASQSALGRLGSQAGNIGPMAMPGAYQAPQNPYAPRQMAPQSGNPYGAMLGQVGQMGQMTPRQGGMAPQGQPMQGQPQGGPQAPQGDMVTVQAPNGQTARLPRQQAEMAVQKGARIVPTQGVQ